MRLARWRVVGCYAYNRCESIGWFNVLNVSACPAGRMAQSAIVCSHLSVMLANCLFSREPAAPGATAVATCGRIRTERYWMRTRYTLAVVVALGVVPLLGIGCQSAKTVRADRVVSTVQSRPAATSAADSEIVRKLAGGVTDRKSTRLNSSH